MSADWGGRKNPEGGEPTQTSLERKMPNLFFDRLEHRSYREEKRNKASSLKRWRCFEKGTERNVPQDGGGAVECGKID